MHLPCDPHNQEGTRVPDRVYCRRYSGTLWYEYLATASATVMLPYKWDDGMEDSGYAVEDHKSCKGYRETRPLCKIHSGLYGTRYLSIFAFHSGILFSFLVFFSDRVARGPWGGVQCFIS